MSRRERLKAKLEKRELWADKAKGRADQHFASASRIADNIPLGQPILLGHHSERHARRDAERIRSSMTHGVEEQRLAQHHASCAAGLADQLDRSVFSDDENAIEQLEARIAENEAERDRRKLINRLFKKRDTEGLANLGLNLERLEASVAQLPSFDQQPYPGYSLTNLGARIRSDRKRIDEIRARTARAERANAGGGVVIEGTGEYVRVTFAEKPTREVLDALRAAGFSWGAGSWCGRRDRLPAESRTAAI